MYRVISHTNFRIKMHFGYKSFLFDSHILLFITLIFTSVIKQKNFRYSFARLHDITSQKSIIVIFIAASRTNPIPTICNS